MGWEQGKTFIVQRHLQSKFGAHGKFALILEGANRARDIQAGAKSFIEDPEEIKGHKCTVVALKELAEDKWSSGYIHDKNGKDIAIPGK